MEIQGGAIMEELTMDQIRREDMEMDAIDAMMEADRIAQLENAGYERCKRCDCYVVETTNGVCEGCIDEIMEDTTLEDVIEYAATLEEDNELALYTDYLFTKEQLIAILKREARSAVTINSRIFDDGIKNYIDCDVYDYIDYLSKKGDF